MTDGADLADRLLPEGIRSRFVEDVNGLRMHILEAGFAPAGRPCLLLLHGFPELAFSWREVMLPLAEAGFHVVAPDQRGYGRTSGWDPNYDGDLASFRLLNIVQDAMALLARMERRKVAAVIGHDFGSFVAAYCALVRPDVFPAVALMSAPFDGAPALPFGEVAQPAVPDIHAALARLAPPRKHYQWYYGERGADAEMRDPPEGIAAFLRAYFHVKSADWPGNAPYPLAGWTAEELAKLPTYYVMEHDKGMAETVAPHMPSAAEVAACRWLPEEALEYYADAFGRTGFQGGLNWYRCMTGAAQAQDLRLFAGRRIEVPACYIAGAQDWGIYQKPGAFETMQREACSDMRGCTLIEGAGHWVQQEQPGKTAEALIAFLKTLR